MPAVAGAAMHDMSLWMGGNVLPMIAAQGALRALRARTYKQLVFDRVLAPHRRIWHCGNRTGRTLLTSKRANLGHNLTHGEG
jgi:hypothetical protein